MRTEAQKRAAAKYNAAKTKLYSLRLTAHDGDIIAYLENKENKQGAIKAALRKMLEEVNHETN